MQTYSFILSVVYSTTTFAILLFKPLREKIFGIKNINRGVQCLLRSQMLDIYYKHQKDHTMCEYERKNFDKLYDAYTSLGGNSFIQDVYEEVRRWTITR